MQCSSLKNKKKTYLLIRQHHFSITLLIIAQNIFRCSVFTTVSQKAIVILITLLFSFMQSSDSIFAARSLCVRFLLVDQVLHVPAQEVVKEREVR